MKAGAGAAIRQSWQRADPRQGEGRGRCSGWGGGVILATHVRPGLDPHSRRDRFRAGSTLRGGAASPSAPSSSVSASIGSSTTSDCSRRRFSRDMASCIDRYGCLLAADAGIAKIALDLRIFRAFETCCDYSTCEAREVNIIMTRIKLRSARPSAPYVPRCAYNLALRS